MPAVLWIPACCRSPLPGCITTYLYLSCLEVCSFHPIFTAPQHSCPPWPGYTLLPAQAVHPKALPLLLMLRNCFSLWLDMTQPGQLAQHPWHRCHPLPKDWQYHRFGRRSGLSLAQPMCATGPCELAPTQSGWWKKGFQRAKATEGLLGTHSCQLDACDAGGGARQQDHG